MCNGGAGNGGGGEITFTENRVPKIKKVQAIGMEGSKFCSFCENVIIKMTALVWCGWPKKVWIASFPDGGKAID